MKKMINFSAIEKKWQGKWEKAGAFKAKDNIKGRKKFYVLEQYPYPSGSGLHMGHAFIYTIGDIYARFKRMQGYNVLHPIGFDSFGLPAENAAIKNKSHPRKFTDDAIKNFIKQMKGFGLSYDWNRMLKSHDPAYYKWDQWIFLKMLEKGLAYRKKAGVNFCPKCNTVLANEQVVDGKCWRHEDTNVEVKQLEQWFLKTTDYADELLSGLDKLDEWPEMIKTLQRNWIGKSDGTEVDFEIESKNKKTILLVHGWGGKSDGNWFEWLKREFGNKFNIIIPDFPNTDHPVLDEWISEMEKHKSKLDEHSILIGHSLGCPTVCKFLEKTKIKVGKVILVAPSPAGYDKTDFQVIKDLKVPKAMENSLKKYLEELNLDFIDVKKYAGEFVMYISKDDPYLSSLDYRINEYSNLGAELKIFDKKGHFNAETGIVEFHEIRGALIKSWKVFTTRVDTLFGVTFLVVSVQHPELMSLVTPDRKKDVEAFLKKVKSTKDEDRDKMDKEGVFTGSYAIHPLTGKKIPIWAGNFVVSDYGSGIVMADAHDQRDLEFAHKYNIPLVEVIREGENSIDPNKSNKAYTGYGTLVNSEGFNGLTSQEAIEHITIALQEKGLGRKKVVYRLRDWLISRQRFWGCPIPIIYCDNCGAVPVREKDLPVKLPDNIRFQGVENPLKNYKKFTDVNCWKCGGKARRETDTMDTFVDSSWYFLRYLDSKNKNKIFEKKKADYWMPIDLYIGGKEHATMHDIYFRFYTKFLSDLGLVSVREPAKRLFTQGFIYGEDGKKMSKSIGNVIVPEIAAKKYGVDGVRLFLVSVAGPDKDFSWSEEGAQGSLRFILRMFEYFGSWKPGKSSRKLEHYIHRTIKRIEEDIEYMKYNLAIIKLRELFGIIEKERQISRRDLEVFVKMLCIFAPHVSEEFWNKIKGKGLVASSAWPKSDSRKIDDKIEEGDRAVEKLINDIKHIKGLTGIEKPKVYIYSIPPEVKIYQDGQKEIAEASGASVVKVYAVNDKSKYDPEGKAAKSRPGKPGIYVE